MRITIKMAGNWSERERQTNRLVRAVAGWLFAQSKIRPEQLIGLVRLTWIRASHVKEGRYITSVKIPALGLVFGQDYSRQTLAEVAKDVSQRVGNAKLEALVLNDTGFTNIYNAYRNSSTLWLHKNFKKVLPLLRTAYHLRNEEQGRSLAEQIDSLPSIRKPDKSAGAMKPESFLTPVMFALDKRIRFPILNGRPHVRQILAKRGVSKGTLAEKFDAMVSIYGNAGVVDAADLDQETAKLKQFLKISPKVILLQMKSETGRLLPVKGEGDLQILQKERTQKRRSIHNKMTNRLKTLWTKYPATEGKKTSAPYDVMLKNYDGDGRDLSVHRFADACKASIFKQSPSPT
jgi:hypothetical protein